MIRAATAVVLFLFCAPTPFAAFAQSDGKPADPPGTILIEDNDPDAIKTSWDAKSRGAFGGTSASGGTVMEFAFAKNAGDGSKVLTVSPEIPEAGWYQVWMRWITHLPTVAQQECKVPATLFLRGEEEFQFRINMKSGNDWVLLGTYPLDAGKRPLLSFSNQGTTQRANLDAVKLIPVEAKPEPRPVPSMHAEANEFTGLMRNVTEFEVAAAFGRGNEETDPEAIRMAAKNELRARMLWDLMLEEAGTNWSQNGNSASSNRTDEAANLKRMAVAYVGASNHLGLDLRGNPELRKATIQALENFTVRYNTSTKWDVNWWDYEIGIPLRLLPALILLGDAVPAELREGFTAAVKRFNTDPRKFYNNGFPSTGANRLWLCNVAMYRGALSRDAELLELVNRAIEEPIEYVERDPDANGKKTTDGFYADGSFIQHGGIPYVAAYGYLLLESYSVVAECLQGTPWELTDPVHQNVFTIMEASFDPFVVRGETVQNVVGRSLGSSNYEGNRNAANFVLTATMLLPFADPEQGARLKSLIKKWITEEGEENLLDVALHSADGANAKALVDLRAVAENDNIEPLPPLEGFQLFANMDMATHRTGDFAVSLGMNSTRTTTFESIWGANKTGWYQSEGLTLVYTPDVERYRDNYFKFVDPYRFPGTMVERLERQPAGNGGANPGKSGGGEFVGGVGLNGNGLTVMHLKPKVGDLEARRSWFFFGNQVVALGAGIGADSEHAIETNIENARVLSERQKLIIDGKTAAEGEAVWKDAGWAWLGGHREGADLGWVFLEGSPDLNTLRETRSITQGGATRSMDFATLWFDHGSGLSDGQYAYVLLPGRTTEELAAYVDEPRVEVVNTKPVQAVRDRSRGLIGIAGWEAGGFGPIRFDAPILLMIGESENGLSVAVGDPTMKLTKPVTIQLPYSVQAVEKSNKRIQVKSRSPLELVFDPAGANGQSRRIEFGK